MACRDPQAAAAVASLDPELTLTQPASVTAVTAIDAVSHARETWVTLKRNPVSQLFSREAWRRLSANFERVLRSPEDIEARGEMLLGAHFAGAAIENSMLGAAHACANPLTAHYGVIHGSAVGLMLPAVIRFNNEAVGNLYNELAVSSNGAVGLAEKVDSMLEAAGVARRASQYDVPESALPGLAEEASRQWTANFNPRPVGAKELLEIYQRVY
jgi:alcohol dehydrogenase